MARCVALVRGINVGGNKKLVMAEFREVLAGLGLTAVRTHLNSGNAVFTADATPAALEARIAAAVERELSLRVSCLVRTAVEVRAVLDGNPLLQPDRNGSRMFAVFLSAEPDASLRAAHDPAVLDPGHVAVGDRVVYQWCPDGLSAAPDLGTFLARRWKVTVTARNWNTVTKLAALLEG